MATTPAVKVSTLPKTKEDSANLLMDAIAATIQAGSEGRTGLNKISERLSSQEKSQHIKAMKRKRGG